MRTPAWFWCLSTLVAIWRREVAFSLARDLGVARPATGRHRPAGEFGPAGYPIGVTQSAAG